MNTVQNPFLKKLFLALVLSTALVPGCVMALSARAEDQESPTATQKLVSPDDVVESLGAQLNLSDDQKAQIKPIIEDRRQKLQALRSDTSMRPFQKKRQMNSILSDSDKKINAILNEDQRKQYAEIEKQMREQVKEKAQRE